MKKIYLILTSIAFIAIFILPQPSLAIFCGGPDTANNCGPCQKCENSQCVDISGCIVVSPLPTANLHQQFQFGNIDNMGELSSRFWGIAFSVAGISLLIYTIIGAFKFIVSAGDKNSVASARNMITHAVVGFILLILLFLIFQYLPRALGFNFAVF